MLPVISRFHALRLGYKISIGLVLLLGIFRLFLPDLVKRYVNNKLNDLPGYSGHVNDIDIALLHGAYVLKGLVLAKKTDPPKIPF